LADTRPVTLAAITGAHSLTGEVRLKLFGEGVASLKRHRLISHNAKYIRQNRGTSVLSDADVAHVRLWAPYGLK